MRGERGKWRFDEVSVGTRQASEQGYLSAGKQREFDELSKMVPKIAVRRRYRRKILGARYKK